MLKVALLAIGVSIVSLTASAGSAVAQAPPKGTSYTDCRANPKWWWVGPRINNKRYGKCRRKPAAMLKKQ